MPKAFEIRRNDADESTAYTIDGQSFVVRDLRFGRYHRELPAQVDDIVTRMRAAFAVEHATTGETFDALMAACAGELAALWCWFVEKPDAVDAAWIDEHATGARLAQVYAQLVKDNRLDGIAKMVEERYLPFVLRVAETNAMATMAATAVASR